jgi:hypothetical protein
MSAPIADGGAAFPSSEMYDNEGRVITVFKENGMTLRDYFAAASLPVLTKLWQDASCTTDAELVAAEAYHIADAMIEARKAVK